MFETLWHGAGDRSGIRLEIQANHVGASGCVKNFGFKVKDVGKFLKDLWQSSNM